MKCYVFFQKEGDDAAKLAKIEQLHQKLQNIVPVIAFKFFSKSILNIWFICVANISFHSYDTTLRYVSQLSPQWIF